MKKLFEEPVLDIITFDPVDIITTSGDPGVEGGGGVDLEDFDIN